MAAIIFYTGLLYVKRSFAQLNTVSPYLSYFAHLMRPLIAMD